MSPLTAEEKERLASDLVDKVEEKSGLHVIQRHQPRAPWIAACIAATGLLAGWLIGYGALSADNRRNTDELVRLGSKLDGKVDAARFADFCARIDRIESEVKALRVDVASGFSKLGAKP